MKVLILILNNIIGYDGLIFIVGAINLKIYYKIKSTNSKSNEMLYTKNNIPLIYMLELHLDNIKNKIDMKNNIDFKKLEELFENERVVNKNYSIFISITSIFPLMGIAGTVLALLTVSEFTSELISQNFLSALTSTFWGVVWGGVFKVLEGFISPMVVKNSSDIDIIRNTLKNKKVGGSFE